MKPGRKIILFVLMAIVPALYIPAQTDIPTILGSPNIPQWVKDLRRWEIVAFGSIPFTMFTATFAMDMYRWQQANGMEFTDEGRRYAPWPMKSAGAVVMKRKEQENVFVIAASLSVAIAVADQVIVQVKRHKERKKAEALPVGTTIINRQPMPEDQDGPEIDGPAVMPDLPVSEQP